MYKVQIDCLGLPMATLRYLLGSISEEEADRVRQELAELAEAMPRAASWHDVWRAWRREVARSAVAVR